MKKFKVLLALTAILLLFTLNFVSAAGIKIGHTIYPLTLFIPIVAIILAIIILIIFLIIRSVKKSKGKSIKKSHKNKRVEGEKEKQEEEKDEKKAKENNKEKIDKNKENKISDKVFSKYLINLRTLKKKQEITDLNELWNKFSKIVRSFFKEFLDMKYEFTYTELALELVKRKKDEYMINFVRRLESRYDKEISRQRVIAMMHDFDIILSRLTSEKIVDGIGAILKNQEKTFSRVMGSYFSFITSRKINYFIKLIEVWEKIYDERKEKKVFLRLKQVYLSLPIKERERLCKNLCLTYEQIKNQIPSSDLRGRKKISSLSTLIKQLEDIIESPVIDLVKEKKE